MSSAPCWTPATPELGALVAAAVAALEERGENFHVRASFGAVLLPHETDSVEFALQLADERMYERKRDRPARSPDHTSEVLRQIMTARHPGLESRWASSPSSPAASGFDSASTAKRSTSSSGPPSSGTSARSGSPKRSSPRPAR